ncbi:MAG TPA: hypothetical protein VKT53_08100 [Candidatus Acidoferrum sp.]|nr:hypothetical protein [Candidatus Acidoferrum sp.]
MKSNSLFRIGVFAAGLASLSAGAFPATIHSSANTQAVAAINKSASGKISAVANDGFSLDIKAGDVASTMQFVTDTKTKVTGSLSVGATVSVEYRTDGDGRNIATAIVVQSNG